MTTYKIQKNIDKKTGITYLIIERTSVVVNGVKGFQDEQTGYEFKSLEQAESKLNLIIKMNS